MKNICPHLAVAALLVATSAGAANLLKNPNFETGDFTGWTTFGLGWRTGIGDDAYEGTYGIVCDVLDWQTGENWRGVYQNVPVTAGATYSAGVSIRSVNVHFSSSWLELQWLDADGGVIEQLQSPWVTADQSFTPANLEDVVAPPGAVSLSVRGIVHLPTSPGNKPEFHIFDDFFLRSKP